MHILAVILFSSFTQAAEHFAWNCRENIRFFFLPFKNFFRCYFSGTKGALAEPLKHGEAALFSTCSAWLTNRLWPRALQLCQSMSHCILSPALLAPHYQLSCNARSQRAVVPSLVRFGFPQKSPAQTLSMYQQLHRDSGTLISRALAAGCPLHVPGLLGSVQRLFILLFPAPMAPKQSVACGVRNYLIIWRHVACTITCFNRPHDSSPEQAVRDFLPVPSYQ